MNLPWPALWSLSAGLQRLRRPDSPFARACARLGEQEIRLMVLLGLGPLELVELRLGPRYHYRPLQVAKRDGRVRRLLAPSPPLKALQRRLLDRYLATLPIHAAATAFHPGASIVANARVHAGQAVVATLDLADFFESTRARRVRAFFARAGWRGDALGILMRLCTYRGSLPPGAPTSPCLSNLVNVELDQALARLARGAGARYTRYGDDLTFSWGDERVPAGFEPAVGAQLQAAGYAIQPRKSWRLRRRAQRPEITGLVLAPDGRVQAPTRVRWRLWRLRLAWWLRRDPATAEQLAGISGFLRSTES